MRDFGWGVRHRSARMAGYMVGAAALTLVWGCPEIKAQTVSARVYSINIPAKPLPKAIADLSAQTGLQVLYTGSQAFRHDSHAVSGRLAPEQALRQMLQGTGLNYHFVRPNAVTLDVPGQASTAAATVSGAIALDTIDVQGANPNSTMTPMPEYAGGQVATGGQVGLLGNRSVMDTPFNQTSYTQKLIQNQQVRRVTDVIMNDPSVTATSTSGGPWEGWNIRGFGQYYTDISVNGLPGIFPSRSVESLERVEILKGPSALLNGFVGGGTIGGNINLVPKRAPDESITRLTNSYRSKSQFGTHLDMGRRFGENKEFGVRSNVAYSNGNSPFDQNNSEEGLATLALDYRNERVRLSTDLGYQSLKQNGVPQFSFNATQLSSIPKPPDGSTNSIPPWTYWREKVLFGSIQGEVDLTDNITAYAAIGANRTRSDYNYVWATLLNARGDWEGEAYRYVRDTTVLAGQAGLRASVDTGPVHHTLSLNVSGKRTVQGDNSNDYTVSFMTNIYNPVYVPDPNLPDPGDPKKTSAARQSSVGIADTMSILDKRVQFTVGVRRQQVQANNFHWLTGAPTNGYDAYAWTPAYALVVKPWENVSLYANYIEGLQQGRIVGVGYANAGQIFPPYQSKQHEVGVKVDWGRITTTVSAFQIAQPNMIQIPGSPLPTQALNGEQRNRGIEVNVFGELTEGVRLLGGTTFFDARLAKTQDGIYDGNKAAGIPDVNFVLGGEWDTPFLHGFTLTGRVNRFAKTFLTEENTLTVPGWTRVDLGARYTFEAPWNRKPVTIRFDVQNVFDSSYWITGGGGYEVAKALPRTYLLSTTFNF